MNEGMLELRRVADARVGADALRAGTLPRKPAPVHSAAALLPGAHRGAAGHGRRSLRVAGEAWARHIGAAAVAVSALAACGPTGQPAGAAGSANTAPASDNSWLWGLGGFLAGRMTAPSAAPAPGVAPVYVDRRTVVQAQAPAPTRSATPPAPTKPPVVTTTPRVTPPTPTMAPKPSYSGASSYRSVTQSAPSYSRSFSSSSSARK